MFFLVNEMIGMPMKNQEMDITKSNFEGNRKGLLRLRGKRRLTKAFWLGKIVMIWIHYGFKFNI